jgi:ssDNA-binding Zn-finger/Zn-ribbon topoisomerase 1
VAWAKPIPEKCPACGNPYMTEKWLKAGTVWQCPNPECKHKQPAPEQPAEVVMQ